MYRIKAKAFRFTYDVVYTNVMSAGAYRGYGATQGLFAVESAVNELAEKLHMDPVVLREKNMVREGEIMPAYYGETANSCALDRCMELAKQMMNWDEKFPSRDMGNGKVRGVGVAMAMQGSGISGVDTASVGIKVNDDGFYSLLIGASDMGTGCDTILSQMTAECLDCEMDEIIVHGVDTDSSPYDTGSYASSTTYVTGMAEVEIDKETGELELIDYVAVVDCGTVVNPSLARVQTEGGIAQGIGMAMYEDVVYNSKGKNYSNSFMQYKIPSRLDVGNIRVEFESSYESSGPFGAKSIGEIVINTPSPAIASAVSHAVGVNVRELPITAEKVYWGMQKEK